MNFNPNNITTLGTLYLICYSFVLHSCIVKTTCKLIYKNNIPTSATEAVLASLSRIPDDHVCVWHVSSSSDISSNSSRSSDSSDAGDVEERFVKALFSSYKAVARFLVVQVDTAPSLCRHNVLVTDGSRCRGLLALSLPLTVDHHYYVLVPGRLAPGQLDLCYKQFGLSRAAFVSLLDGQVLSLSSPLFPDRRFMTSNRTAVLREESLIRVDLQGRPINVATFNCTPFVIIKNKTDPDSINGIEWKVLRNIARNMNFTLRLAELKGPALWGHLLENGSWTGGISRAVYDGDAEIGVCNMWFTQDMHRLMDFATPLNVIKFSFIAPRPKRSQHNWRALVQVFDRNVWFLVLLLFFFCVTTYWKIISSDCKKRARPGLTKCFLTLFGVLMGAHWPSHGGYFGARLVVTLWCMFTLLLASTYNTSIASRLTVQRYDHQIDTIKQLVERDFQWSDDPDNDYDKRVIYFNLADKWQRLWEQRYVPLPTSRMREALRSGKFAFPIQRWGGRLLFFVVPGLDVARDLAHSRIIRETTTNTYVSIMFAKRSPLYNQLELLRVVQAGLTGFWTSQVSRGPQNKYIKRLLYRERGRTDPKQLGMDNLWPAFCILAGGLVTGLGLFILEYMCKRKTKL